jgi:hypothetical protein
MSDYAEWDAASVDLASEIVKEHGRKIEGAALVKIISAKLTKAGHSRRLLLAGMLNRADDGWRLLLAERTTRNGVTCNALLASSSKDRSPPVERSPGDRVPGELVLSRTRCIKL